MTKEDEIKEEKHLKKVEKEISNQINIHNENLSILEKNKKDFSLHFSEDYYTMDDEEQAQEGVFFDDLDNAIMVENKQIDKLNILRYSPYFGRIDFKEDGKKQGISYYIGINNIVQDGAKEPLVCDWRAPVSSLFYDFELGNGNYFAPDGNHNGTINLKRQYKIKNGKMLGAFDSSLTIGDDILKDVLSQNASKKMQTIVSTIQKEQNKIIRDDMHKNLIVQGVAGSGKTSIALHRIAYLLYQNRSTLKAENILIMSPNTLFSDYISNVLPELGEENIEQISFYKLAQSELNFLGLPLETREECVDEITNSAKRLNESAYKNTYDFYESMLNFSKSYFDMIFKPKNIKVGKQTILASDMENLYNITYKSKTPAVRVEWIIDYIIDKLEIEKNMDDVAERLKKIIYPFFAENNILNIYSEFLKNIGMSFKLSESEKIKYDDLGALLYLKNYFFGIKKHSQIKYLIIDEMQDYSYLHYDIFSKIFNCNKIVLGDINQCIDKVMTIDDLNKLSNILNAESITLNRAYRSTYEITQFANKIKNISCSVTERHGDGVSIIDCENNNLQFVIEQEVKKCDKYDSIGILVENVNEAKEIFSLIANIDNASLCLNSEEKLGRVTIMPSYLSKGLEFDAVIIPNYNKYLSTFKKNLLYVSCTRALHNLALINNK